MIKNFLVSVVVLTLAMFILASCATSSAPDAGESTSGTTSNLPKETSTTGIISTAGTEEKNMLDKLRQIEPNWTKQQVYDLLGMPDRFGERSVVAEVFYTVNPTTEAVIAFWSEGIQITVINSETGEKTTMLG